MPATIAFSEMPAVVQQLSRVLRISLKDGVNEAALAITRDARRRVQAVIGPEQRLSGTWYRQVNGREYRVREATSIAGGTRVNPAYKEADAEIRPTALIGARGPAHYIEHTRRADYWVYPRGSAKGKPLPGGGRRRRRGMSGEEARFFEEQFGALTGRSLYAGKTALTIGGLDARPAAHIKRAPIPRRPITKAFEAAPRTVQGIVEREMQKQLNRWVREGFRVGKVAGRF